MNRVTIFSNGIADFCRTFETTGEEQSLEIPVNKDHIGDILSSLIIDGPVKLTVPPNYTPENEITGKLHLSAENVFQDIFKRLRGSEVEIKKTTSESPVAGRVFGLDSEEKATGGEAVREYFGQVLTSNGLVRVRQSEIESINFTQDTVQSEVDKALGREFQTIKPRSTTVSLKVDADEVGKSFSLHYAIPAAAWKMTYRLTDTGAGIRMDGVGVVDNNTEEDWDDFLVGLVVGEPITFSTDVATSKIPSRSNVNLVASQAQGAVVANQGYAPEMMSMGGGSGIRSRSAPKRGMVQAACATPDMDMEMDDCALESLGFSPEYGGAMDAATSHQDVGDFSLFEFKSPLTIKAGTSAEIPVFNAVLDDADSVLYFDPANNPNRPFRAIKFKNETGHSLGKGVCTVYDKGTYAGSAIVNATKEGEDSLVCHAVETGVRVKTTVSEPEIETVGYDIDKGTGIQKTRYLMKSTSKIRNIKSESFKFVFDHKEKWQGSSFECTLNGELVQPKESIPGGHRFEIDLGEDTEVIFSVVETKIAEQNFAISDNWLEGYRRHSSHPIKEILSSEISKAFELRESITNLQEELQVLRQESNSLESEQARLHNLIKSDPNETQYKSDLKTSEARIRELTRDLMPKVSEAISEAQSVLRDFIHEITFVWNQD